jgi:uncharacterized integral membrane protein
VPDDPDLQSRGEVERGGPSAGLIVAGVLVALLVVFVLQNTQRTRVTFLFFDGRAPLFLVLLLTALVGAVVAEVGSRVMRRRREKS